MFLAATAGDHINFGPYILILLTAGLAVIGWLLRDLVNNLRELRKEQNVQSSGLAVLVERINPVGQELAEHETRLRANENGLEHLRGALANNTELTKHLISLRLDRDRSG